VVGGGVDVKKRSSRRMFNVFTRQVLIGDEFSVGQIPKTQELIKAVQEELASLIGNIDF
jgi:hypothetical protein